MRCKACDKIMEPLDTTSIQGTDILEELCLVCREKGQYTEEISLELKEMGEDVLW